MGYERELGVPRAVLLASVLLVAGCGVRQPRELSREREQALLASQFGLPPSRVRWLPPAPQDESHSDTWQLLPTGDVAPPAALVETTHDRVLTYDALSGEGLLCLPGAPRGGEPLTEAEVVALAQAWARRLYLFDVPRGRLLECTVTHCSENGVNSAMVFVHMDGAGRHSVPRCLQIGFTSAGRLEAINNTGGW